jgi:cytochrome c oxidase assembly protein subunit 11
LHRKFKIIFKSENDEAMPADFEPVQQEVIVGSGETALTFYRAYNPTDSPVIGKYYLIQS